MPSALVLLAEGGEEMEIVITTDVLRRAGVEVTIAGLDGTKNVLCSRGVVIVPDKALHDVAGHKFDLVVIPGGLKGAENIAKNSMCGEILRTQDGRKGLVAAICAGPTAFIPHKVAQGRTVTSYPSFQAKMEQAGHPYSQERVCIDGHVITSRGPGTSFEFALALATQLTGVDQAQKLGPGMLVH